MLNYLFCAIIECLLKNSLVICCNKKNMFDHSLVVVSEMLQPTALKAESLTYSFSEHPLFNTEMFWAPCTFWLQCQSPFLPEAKAFELSFHCWNVYYREGYLGLSIRFVTSFPDFTLYIVSTVDYKNRWQFLFPEPSLNPTDLEGAREMWWIHLSLYHILSALHLFSYRRTCHLMKAIYCSMIHTAAKCFTSIFSFVITFNLSQVLQPQNRYSLELQIIQYK